MKFIYIVPILVITLALTWTFKLKGETKASTSPEKVENHESHDHDHSEKEGDDHGHGEEEGDDHGHGEEEGDDHDHGEEEGDDHGHGEEEGDDHGHGEEEGDDHGHGEEEGGDEHGHGHGGGEKVGENMAITEVSEEKGFKLSKEAFDTLNVKLQNVSANEMSITISTLVTSKNKTGIYRYREGYFKFIPVTIRNKSKTGYLVYSNDLQSGDQIVTEGVGLIAISDVYSTDTAEYGHGH